MKAVVYHGHEDFRVEQVKDPEIQAPTDAVVRVERTAICGSDLHMWHGPTMEIPGFTMGHEVLGVVDDVGADVQHLERGDRVIVSCTTGCGTCWMCRHDEHGGCTTLTPAGPYTNVFGNPVLPGGQAEGLRVPFADVNLYKVDPRLDDERVLFLTDILPTGFMGADLADIEVGDVVVVFGCGPVGVFAQLSAELFGPSAIIAVDLDDRRLAKAKERGCIPVNPDTQDLMEVIREHSDGRGADCAIEAVGSPALVQRALEVIRPGGRVSIVGVVTDDQVPIPIMTGLMAKSATMRAGLVSPHKYIPRLLPLIEQGRLDPSQIITHRLPLDRAIDGYRTFANHEEDVLKVVLEP